MPSSNHGRNRTWSSSCSSKTFSIYARINQCAAPAEPTEGHPTVYGSFTTTVPATLPLRAHLSLDIPVSTRRSTKRRDLECGYDTPPDSPLSFFNSLSGPSRSPSISRTLLTDFDLDERSTGLVASPSSTSSPPQSPSTDHEDSPGKLHPLLEAAEAASKISCKAVCSTCMKAGTNFPQCPRCGAMWCSRACRLQGGKRHICAIRKK